MFKVTSTRDVQKIECLEFFSKLPCNVWRKKLCESLKILVPYLSSTPLTNTTPITRHNLIGLNRFLHSIRLLYESHLTNSNLSHEWSDYISPAKRPHHSLMLSSSALPHLINHPSLFEYQNGIHSHQEQMVSNTEKEEKNKTLCLFLVLLLFTPPPDGFGVGLGRRGGWG